MLQIFAHPNLSHQLVFVPVHTGQLSHVSKNILKTVRQLESVHVIQSVLHVRVNNQLGEP